MAFYEYSLNQGGVRNSFYDRGLRMSGPRYRMDYADVWKHFYYDPKTNSLTPLRRRMPDLIVDRLYLGDQKNAYSQKIIQQLGITHVLSVTIIPDEAAHAARFPSSVKYAYIPCVLFLTSMCNAVQRVLDVKDQDIKQYFPRANAFIDQALESGGTVLVHCVWGMSRSATIVIAYLMQKRNMNFESALRFVQAARPIASPNEGFMRQLAEWGQELATVEFTIHFQTKYGQNLHMVGNVPELGGWQCTDANRMQWCGSGIWKIIMPLYGRTFSYKYVVREPDGKYRWEVCGDRLFDGHRRYVRDWWDATTTPQAADVPLMGV